MYATFNNNLLLYITQYYIFIYNAVTDSTIASGGDTITNFHFIGSTIIDRLKLNDVMDFNTSLSAIVGVL
jgi:hypothetical protein